MENKDIVIIALIVVIIYLYYQQNQENSQSPHIIESPITQQLRSELNHYQTLYKNRVKKDLDAETLNSDWESRYNQLENLNNQTNREKNELTKYQVLIEKKVEDLENTLLNLAKQKIKGKKEAERLLSDLEIQWKQDKENWQQQETNLKNSWQTDKDNWQIERKELKNSWSNLEQAQKKLTNEKEELSQTIANLTETEKNLQQQITQQQATIKDKDQQIQNNLNLLQKKEQEIKEVKAQLTQQEQVNQATQNISQSLQQEHQEKLRKINVLFDPNSANYETINFEGLYQLLTGIQQKQTCPQQESSTQTDDQEQELADTMDNLLHQIQELQKLC